MTARLRNVVGAEFDVETLISAPYEAPNMETVGDQQADILALQSAVLALANKIRTITATTTLLTSDKTVLVDATTAPVIVSLPTAASTVGQIITVKKIDVSVNTVMIDPNGSELIEGIATNVIAAVGNKVTFQSNGAGWFII